MGSVLVLAIARTLDREVFTGPILANTSHFKILAEKDAEVIRALAPVILAGGLSDDAVERERAIQEVVTALDRTVMGLSPAVQKEVQQLLSLLTFNLSRRWIAGVNKPWNETSAAEVKTFLDAWRNHRFQILQQGYQALARVIIACWYGNPRSWQTIGYTGPPFAEQLGAR